MSDAIDCRIDFQRFCVAHDIHWLREPQAESQLLDRFLVEYFYRRRWDMVDVLLQIAEERRLKTQTIQRFRLHRKLPPWVFRLADRVRPQTAG
jgi:hypothetical protein